MKNNNKMTRDAQGQRRKREKSNEIEKERERECVCVCMCVCIYLPNPSVTVGCDARSIFKRSKADLNTEFSVSLTGYLTKAKEPSLPNYLIVTGGFMPFSRALTRCEMQAGFKIRSLISFSMMVTVILSAVSSD